MEIEALIQTVALWLNVVDVATAWPRVEQMQARSHAKDAAAAGAIACRESFWDSASATHEAAHAVVAHRSGLRVGYARIRLDGSGAVAYEADPLDVTEMIGRVAADLAGILVELLEDAHPWRRQALAQSCDVLLARLNADVCRELMPAWALTNRFFATVAYCTVMSNWDAIERTAYALRVAGELSGERIRALCSAGLRVAQ